MTCRDLAGFLLEYASGELPSHVAAEFQTHLTDCPNCVVFLEQYQGVIALGRSACDDPDLASVPDELVTAIVAALGLKTQA